MSVWFRGALALALAAAPAPVALPAEARQLLVVTTPDWKAVHGQLLRFERGGAQEPWRPVGEAVPVSVGKKGMGWGVGFGEGLAGPTKVEGDARAPAGVFALGTAFGAARADKAPALHLPYLPLSNETECVDDVKSTVYNQLVSRGAFKKPDWRSSERMLAVGAQYRLGVVVQYNQPPVVGRGSCIFLHINSAKDRGTAGCTAMKEPALLELLQWVDKDKHPTLVQLPEGEFNARAAGWKLEKPRKDTHERVQ